MNSGTENMRSNTMRELSEFQGKPFDDQLANLRHLWEKFALDSWVLSLTETECLVLVQLNDTTPASYVLNRYFTLGGKWSVSQDAPNGTIEDCLLCNEEHVLYMNA